MSLPLVSIIIPVYNAGLYLEETLQSALAQTWPNKEILIIDDGSADNSLAIAKKFEAPNVKIFSQANNGASAARNKGLSHATGDFIQFLDADDLLPPSKIENQLAAIQNLDHAIAYCPFGVFASGNDLPRTAENYLNKSYQNGSDFLFDLYGGRDGIFSTGGMVPTVCWLVSKSVLQKAGTWNETVSVDDDGEFFCRVALNAKNISYVATTHGFYRAHTHNQNLSSQSSCKAYTSAFRSIQLKKKHLNDKRFDTLLANHALQLMVNVYPKCRELCREIERFIKDLGGSQWYPYRENLHKIFRQLFGWRFVKLLSYYKNK